MPSQAAFAAKACLAGLGLLCLCFFVATAFSGSEKRPKVVLPPVAFAGSASCRECHKQFYDLWAGSFHGATMQSFTRDFGKSNLTEQVKAIRIGTNSYWMDLGRCVMLEAEGGRTNQYGVVQVIGGKDVFYFLTQLERGRLQVLPIAFDSRRKEWFDTTASAMRHFDQRSDEALFWKERPLTFNTSCFNCHVSQKANHYDVESDSYHTSWGEPGINCETCHGPSSEHVRLFRNRKGSDPMPKDMKLVVVRKLTVKQRNEMCASCHAKIFPLTDGFEPGEKFFDHFDLAGLEDADFYPDGRDLGENYTYTQWLLNPCMKSGELDCVHCHTSSGRFRHQSSPNNACLPCHEEKVRHVAAHSHHRQESKGALCISCHMPTTEFARIRRSDHSMRPPMPRLTQTFHSPNACNLCHTNRDAAWAEKNVRLWHSGDLETAELRRATLIDAARKKDWSKLPEMLAFLSQRDQNEVFTVSLVRLLGDCPSESKETVFIKLLESPSSWVRASAAEALDPASNEESRDALLKLINDPCRLVRVRAASSLSRISQKNLPPEQLAQVHHATQELVASMRVLPDLWLSHYDLGNLYVSQGNVEKGLAEFQTALRFQPNAFPAHLNLALALNSIGRNDESERQLREAIRISPTNIVAQLNLGMLMSEMNRLTEAENVFRRVFQLDPACAQAAYNLGVLASRTKPEQTLQWCEKATSLRPEEPKYAYSLAYFQVQQGKNLAAVETLKKLIQVHSNYVPAYLLLGKIHEERGDLTNAILIYRQAAGNTQLTEKIREQFSKKAAALSEKNVNSGSDKSTN